MYQNKLELFAASKKEWRFTRGDKSVIADRVKLRQDGVIEGHYHPNEVGWAIRGDAIVFLDSDGKISTAFNHMTYRDDEGQIVDVALRGNFRETAGYHFLTERHCEEVAEHDPGAVDRGMEIIQSVPAKFMRDVAYIEHTLIPSLGLNNEILNEQPPELSPHFGKGLFLWQYPNQFAKYLAWLTTNATDIECFAEIGCRWGGTFIVVSEWLKRVSPTLRSLLAVDPIAPSPFMRRYLELSNGGPVAASYLQGFSTGDECRERFAEIAPDMVFVDGDHDLPAALADHLLARKTAKIIVHHDIISDVCPQTTLLWNAVREMETNYVAEAFVDQYPSVKGSFLGIGCLKRTTG